MRGYLEIREKHVIWENGTSENFGGTEDSQTFTKTLEKHVFTETQQENAIRLYPEIRQQQDIGKAKDDNVKIRGYLEFQEKLDIGKISGYL